MIPENYESEAAEWSSLLERYRDACGSPEGSRNFTPNLWQKIDAKRSRATRFESAAKSLFAAAVGLSLVLGAVLMISGPQPSAFYSGSFVEEIASADTAANGTFFEPVHLELTAVERRQH